MTANVQIAVTRLTRILRMSSVLWGLLAVAMLAWLHWIPALRVLTSGHVSPARLFCLAPDRTPSAAPGPPCEGCNVTISYWPTDQEFCGRMLAIYGVWLLPLVFLASCTLIGLSLLGRSRTPPDDFERSKC